VYGGMAMPMLSPHVTMQHNHVKAAIHNHNVNANTNAHGVACSFLIASLNTAFQLQPGPANSKQHTHPQLEIN
jgi:hypothetical protein